MAPRDGYTETEEDTVYNSPDNWHDDRKDRQLSDAQHDALDDRFKRLTRTPIVYHSPAVLAQRAAIARGIAERQSFAAADSLFGVL